jgi:FKBP-type peptidyl-prolyl cis-trans isomerase
MAQTVNNRKDTPQPQKQYRPGQRQQEKLMRKARRQRQRMIIAASLLGVVLVVLAGIGVWQYPRIVALFHRPPVKVTKHVKISSSCSVATNGSSLYVPTPSAGPAAPPAVETPPATLASGLQCIDLKVGSGSAAQIGTALSVQYTGWLAKDGKKFDSSYDRHAQPFDILLGQKQVIKGWEEGLVGMKTGGLRRLIIPPALAYGAQGQPPTIPGNATLIFDVLVVSQNTCSVATSNNIYNSTPTPNPATPVVGPVIPATPTAGLAGPPAANTTPGMLTGGLKCIDLQVGTGAPAQSGNAVSVQYTGWLAATGKEFDSSYDHGGKPIQVTIGQGQVIKGFEEGLVGMKVGGTRRIIIPGDLGYGAQGSPPKIPANATLIFDITVVSIS